MLFSFYLQKTDDEWGQNFLKNFEHLPFVQKIKLKERLLAP